LFDDVKVNEIAPNLLSVKRGRGGSKAKTAEEQGGGEEEADTALLLSRQFKDAMKVDSIKNPMALKHGGQESRGPGIQTWRESAGVMLGDADMNASHRFC